MLPVTYCRLSSDNESFKKLRFFYQNADWLPWLSSRPVAWGSSLVPEKTRDVDRGLRPGMMELSQSLVWRTPGVGGVGNIGSVGNVGSIGSVGKVGSIGSAKAAAGA